jgi:hypothetical protein
MAASARTKRVERGMRDADESADVQVDLTSGAFHLGVDESPTRAETCVVHDEVDRRIGGSDACIHGVDAGRGEQVSRENLEVRIPRCDLLEPIGTSRHENARNTGVAEEMGELFPDPGGGPGDEGSPEGVSGHDQ